MRKFLWAIVAALLMGFGVPRASASPVFTCIGPCASLPTGSATATAIDFTVFGHTIDFTGLSLSASNQYGWAISSDVLTLTDITAGSPVLAPLDLSFAASNEHGLINLYGTPTTATPEPSSVVLAVLGVGLAFLARKRMRLAVSRAA
ncbi:MAG: PEP-CTERM sorting domain-containing protein [Candidatus Acidiferrales bacterium]